MPARAGTRLAVRRQEEEDLTALVASGTLDLPTEDELLFGENAIRDWLGLDALTADAKSIREDRRIYDDVSSDLLGPSYQRAARRMVEELEGKSLGLEPTRSQLASWRRILREELDAGIQASLTAEGTVASQLRQRGVISSRVQPGTLERYAQTTSKQILGQTDDLLRTLHKSVRLGDRVEQTGTFSVERLLSDEHTATVGRSLGQRASDNFESRVAGRNPKLTGKRRWVTSGNPDSRHADLQGIVVGPGESFPVPTPNDRNKNHRTLARGPRDPKLPVGASSLCSCFVEYQDTEGNWH